MSLGQTRVLAPGETALPQGLADQAVLAISNSLLFDEVGRHERWDGAGYPRGISGETIPLAARIFAIADVWDALADRPYRAAWPRERVLAHIRAEAGRHFNPRVVEALVEELSEADPPRAEPQPQPVPRRLKSGSSYTNARGSASMPAFPQP
ncbi:MAG: hypothetical protein RLZZ387_1825 [Chloroflexota bacterium]